jgi:pantoate--beta-alanine ligase
MYAPEAQVTVDPGQLGSVLEGAVRPAHFAGVATVVAKLFSIVQPDLAFFGEKDYQQLLVVKRLVRDLDLPVAIVAVPTVRESDGLAMSSRNEYLTPAERAAAPVLKRSLDRAADLGAAGESDPRMLESAMVDVFADEPAMTLDYAVVRDADTLAEIALLTADRPARALVAARLPSARLIDNAAVELGM